jgi:hypothetical protein
MLHICLSAALYRPVEVHQAIVENGMTINISTDCTVPNSIDCAHVHHTPDGRLATIPEDGISLVRGSRDKLSTTDLPQRLSMIHSVEDLSTNSTVIYTENILNSKSNHVEGCLTEKSVQTEPAIGYSEKKNRRFKFCSLLDYIDLSLIKNPMFLLMATTVMFMAAGCPHLLYYLPSYANSRGLKKSECSLLLSISAVFDLCGRLGLGYIADFNLFSKTKAYSVR